MGSKLPLIATRLTREMRARIEAQIVDRRHRTGKNLTISEWMREAAEEKLTREVPTIAPPSSPEAEAGLTFEAGTPTP